MRTVFAILFFFTLSQKFHSGELLRIRATHKGIELHGLSVVGQEFGPDCPVQEIEGKIFASMNCLEAVRGLVFNSDPGAKSLLIKLQIFLPDDLRDSQYFLNYSSSYTTMTSTVKMIHTAGLKRGEVSNWKIVLPRFKKAKPGYEDIGFGYQSTFKDFKDMVKAQKRAVTRYERVDDRLDSLLEKSVHRLSFETGALFHSIEFLPTDREQLATSKQGGYPSLWESTWARGFLLLIFGWVLFLSAFQMRYALSKRILLLFFFPLSLFSLSLSYLVLPLLSEFEKGVIYDLKANLKEHYSAIHAIHALQEDQVLQRSKKAVKELMDYLKKAKRNEKGFPESIIFSKNHQRGAIPASSTLEEIFETLQLARERHFQAGKVAYSKFPDLLDSFQRKYKETELEGLKKDRRQLKNRLDDYAEQADPISFELDRMERKLGVKLSLSNGRWYYRPRDIGVGYPSGSFLSKALNDQVLYELDRSSKTSIANYMHKMDQVAILRSTAAESGVDTLFLDVLLDNPLYLVPYVRGGSTSKPEKNFWLSQQDPTGDNWFIMGESMYSGLLGIKPKLDSYFQKSSKESGVLCDYYFSSSYLGDAFPTMNQNRFSFDLINALVRENDIDSYFLVDNEQEKALYFAAQFSPEPGYYLVLRLDLELPLKSLSNYKNALYAFCIFLALVLVYLSYFLSKEILTPVTVLSAGLKRIGKGDFSGNLPLIGQDEFTSISEDFNDFIRELREKEELTSFLSEERAEEILESEELSQREQVVVLFCGILNLEEVHLKENSLELIHLFVSIAQDSILEHGGLVDKFTGMALLSVFREEHKADSIKSAIQIKRSLKASQELDGVKVGIGLSHGPVITGHVGSSSRKDFTAIGNTVNMAARLETLGKSSQKSQSIFVDEPTFELFHGNGYEFISHEAMEIKGKTKKQKVYELL